MSKRKPPKTSKKAGRGKMPAQAKQAIVKSPRRTPAPPAAEDAPAIGKIPKAGLRGGHRPAEQENKRFEESSSDSRAAKADANASALSRPDDGLNQKAHVDEMSEPQRGRKPGEEMKGFDLFSVAARSQGFQTKLLEISNANINLAFEFAQRVARIRSPVEFIAASSEFASKRIALSLRHSREIGELVLGRPLFG
jgi:hypothetical protein